MLLLARIICDLHLSLVGFDAVSPGRVPDISEYPVTISFKGYQSTKVTRLFETSERPTQRHNATFRSLETQLTPLREPKISHSYD
jgi:hypothetical protein